MGREPSGGEAAGIRALLNWFDDARLIVAYNGRDFDMRVLHGMYDAEEGTRRQAHLAKLVDPAEIVRRATGRRAKLSTLLRLNTRGTKEGSGCDAPRWWQEGRLAQLQRYCAQDVRVLADLVVRAEVRLPGGGTTRDASVREALLRSTRDESTTSDSAAVQCAQCGRLGGEAADALATAVGARVDDAMIARLHAHGVVHAAMVTERTIEEYRLCCWVQ